MNWYSNGFKEAFGKHSPSLGALCVFGLLSLMYLSGCTLLPGMDVHYYANEVVEGPTELPYTLVRITPTLIDNLNGVQEAFNKKIDADFPLSTQAMTVYRLGIHDSLQIFVWGNPDLTPTLSVASGNNAVSTSPSGRIINDQGNVFFPMVGEVHAAGLSVREFREELTKRLSKFIKDPQVEVTVASFRSQKAFIWGAVTKPGPIQITDITLKIADALTLVGIGPETELDSVLLTRDKKKYEINLDRLYYKGETNANVVLQDGDTISVPDRSYRKVYVAGEVGNSNGGGQARPYPMHRGRVSLTEILMDAGGPNPFSSAANYIFVMRSDENGDPIIYRLAARDPLALLMADKFEMHKRDVLFVSPTDLTEFGRIIAQLFPLTNSVQTVNSINTTFN